MKKIYSIFKKSGILKDLLLVFVLACTFTPSFADDADIVLDLTAPANPTSFEFNADGVWSETYNEIDYTYWESQVFMFSHLIDGEGSSYGGFAWNGFTVSRNADTSDHSTDGWAANQWGCIAGGGIESIENGVVKTSKDRPYILGYWNSYAVQGQSLSVMFNDGNDYYPVGVYVANSPWPYYENINGGAFSRALNKEGDYFKLTAHGVSAGGDEEKTVDFMLASFSDGVLHQSDKWEWMDLSPLGKVSEIFFTLDSSDKSDYGMNTSVYFCLDRFTVSSTLSGISENVSGIANITAYYVASTDAIVIKSSVAASAFVYGSNGIEIAAISLEPEENTISLAGKPAGLYIVKCGTETFKVVKR